MMRESRINFSLKSPFHMGKMPNFVKSRFLAFPGVLPILIMALTQKLYAIFVIARFAIERVKRACTQIVGAALAAITRMHDGTIFVPRGAPTHAQLATVGGRDIG